MFIVRQNDSIVLTGDSREALEKAALLMSNINIEETDIDYQNVGGEYVTSKVAREKEKESVAQLKMTPRDFLLSVINLGATWEGIKQLMDTNAQVAIELQFCNHVYRGNPLLDQFCEQFGISSEQLDTLFKNKGF